MATKKQNAKNKKSVGGGQPSEVKEVDLATCVKIVIETTPVGASDDPSQKLRELGVINDDQAEIHRAKIRKRMQAEGGDIDANNISSGPTVTVADCAGSVFENQDGGKAGAETVKTTVVAKPALKEINLATCFKIVVETTPVGKSDDPSQKLRELGIINNDEAGLHRARIQKRMQKAGGDIDARKINSGPNVTVADCAGSVFEKQDGV
ncbi:MAG TPA: hypothetical protein VJW20_11400 [Candidatus Angelobacter sp.]|nr:hypothetical protein [Candidatus Angelobacter sp.]